jgi:hypothetical protein
VREGRVAKWRVDGTERVHWWVEVEAETEQEAIDLATAHELSELDPEWSEQEFVAKRRGD